MQQSAAPSHPREERKEAWSQLLHCGELSTRWQTRSRRRQKLQQQRQKQRKQTDTHLRTLTHLVSSCISWFHLWNTKQQLLEQQFHKCRYVELIRLHISRGIALFVGQPTMLTRLSPCCLQVLRLLRRSTHTHTHTHAQPTKTRAEFACTTKTWHDMKWIMGNPEVRPTT